MGPGAQRDPHRDPYRDPYRNPHRDPYRDPHRDPYGDPYRVTYRDPHRDPYRVPYRGPWGPLGLFRSYAEWEHFRMDGDWRRVGGEEACPRFLRGLTCPTEGRRIPPEQRRGDSSPLWDPPSL